MTAIRFMVEQLLGSEELVRLKLDNQATKDQLLADLKRGMTNDQARRRYEVIPSDLHKMRVKLGISKSKSTRRISQEKINIIKQDLAHGLSVTRVAARHRSTRLTVVNIRDGLYD